MKKGFSPGSVWLIVGLVVLMGVVNLILFRKPGFWFWGWLINLALVVGVVGLIGFALTGRPAGVVIDNRAKVSLSKFQMTLWTIVVISSLITIATLNMHHFGIGITEAQAKALGFASAQDYDPLKIDIPTTLLAALGISSFSLVATPMILSTKADAPPAPQDVDKALDKLGLQATDLSNAGKVFGRTDPQKAAWADMFRGDELGNAATVDLSKVQQFLITLLLVGVYCGFLISELKKGQPITTLPPLSDSFIWLMSISHASYLAFKAVPHTKTGDGPAAPADPRVRPVG